DAVADAVVDLLGDEERRARLSAAGFRYAGDHADLEASIQDFAQLISERLGVHMHPRGPEHTERAPSADGPPSELDLPMVSDVELLQTLVPDGPEVPRPVSMERFSAER